MTARRISAPERFVLGHVARLLGNHAGPVPYETLETAVQAVAREAGAQGGAPAASLRTRRTVGRVLRQLEYKGCVVTTWSAGARYLGLAAPSDAARPPAAAPA